MFVRPFICKHTMHSNFVYNAACSELYLYLTRIERIILLLHILLYCIILNRTILYKLYYIRSNGEFSKSKTNKYLYFFIMPDVSRGGTFLWIISVQLSLVEAT